MRVTPVIGIALMLVAVSSPGLRAQAAEDPTGGTEVRVDVSLGLGPGSYGVGGQFALGVSTPVGEFIARSAGTSEFNILSMSESAADLALLYGRRKSGSRGWVRAAAGPAVAESIRAGPVVSCSFIFCNHEPIKSYTAGLAVQGDAVWAVVPAFGLGASLFANLNPQASFGGMTVGVWVGSLR